MPRGIYERKNNVHSISMMNEREMDKRIHDLESQLTISEAQNSEKNEQITELKEENKMLEREVSRLSSIIIEAMKTE